MSKRRYGVTAIVELATTLFNRVEAKERKLRDKMNKAIKIATKGLERFGVSVEMYCRRICIDINLDNGKIKEIDEDQFADVVRKVVKIAKKISELYDIYRADRKAIHEWKTKALLSLLRGNEIPDVPELKFPDAVDKAIEEIDKALDELF